LKPSIFAAVAAILATGSIVGDALAITNGRPDGNGHPDVGALLVQHPFSDGTWEECSGTLIAPHVFLTAAHCDEGVSRVEVTFASTFDRADEHDVLGYLAR
jgi:trypsin